MNFKKKIKNHGLGPLEGVDDAPETVTPITTTMTIRKRSKISHHEYDDE